MLSDVKTSLISQFGASLNMVETAIRECPENVWLMEIRGHRIWQVIYHCLFYADFYGNGLDPSLNDPSEEFAPGPIFQNKSVPSSSLTEHGNIPLTQELALQYIEYLRGKTNKMINNCTEERFKQKAGFSWLPMNNLELVMYFTRHVMQHVGQVSAYIRERYDISVHWSGRWSVPE